MHRAIIAAVAILSATDVIAQSTNTSVSGRITDPSDAASVHIEQILADRKAYDVTAHRDEELKLPSRIRDLQIDYTAPSLVAPESVQFRYKLEGWDREWQDAGIRQCLPARRGDPHRPRFRRLCSPARKGLNEAVQFFPSFCRKAWYSSSFMVKLCSGKGNLPLCTSSWKSASALPMMSQQLA